MKDRNFNPYTALLDADEQNIVESFEKGEWKTVDDFKQQASLAQQTATHSLNKDARVNIRLSSHGFYRYLIITLILLTQNFISASNKKIEEDITDPFVKLSEIEKYDQTSILLEKNDQPNHNNDSEKLFILGLKLSSIDNKPQPILKDESKVVF